MNAIQCAAAALLLGLASHAQAASLGYCYVDFGKGTEATRYVSGIIEVGNESGILSSGGSFREAFLDHVRSRYESGANVVACDTWETLNDARRAAFELGIPGDVIRVRTGWLGGRREAGDGKAAKPASRRAAEIPTVAPPVATATNSPKPAVKPQWEIEYEAKAAAHEQELAKYKAALADFERESAEVARRNAESAERARRARAEWEKAVAACNAGDLAACQLAPE